MRSGQILDDLRKVAQAQDDSHTEEILLRAVSIIESLGHQVDTLRQRVKASYRPSSEKVDPGQLAFDLLGFLAHHPSQTPPSQEDKRPEHAQETSEEQKPKRQKRRSGVKLLPVDEVTKDVDDDKRVCGCGAHMVCIGHDTRRQIVHKPQELRMLEERLAKYACGVCKDQVVTAEGTPKPIEKGLASSSLLAHLSTSKTLDAIPVERTGRQLARHGIDIAPSTLHGWFGRAGELCRPLHELAREQLLASDLISLDDTRLMAKTHVRDDGSSKPLKGRLWLYVSDINETAFCEYTPNWKGEHPRAVLKGYTGSIQSDGYGGLNPLFGGALGPKKVGCNDHARRKFVNALRDGDRRADAMVGLYGELYAVERLGREQKLKPPDLLKLRQAESRPIWEAMTWEAKRLASEVERKSALGKALIYWEKQYSYLAAFVDDADLPIANAHIERLLRAVALMRKNSLFVGNQEAGERYAMLLTVVLNCVLCGANPYVFLSEVFNDLCRIDPGDDVDHLMPRAWLARQEA